MELILKNIDQIKEIKERLSNYRRNGWESLFRGQANSNWVLTTSLLRECGAQISEKQWNLYLEYFKEFKKIASSSEYQLFRVPSQNEDFYYASIARHLGMPSHFLDWTLSIEMAIEMACNDLGNIDKDGTLWIMKFYKSENLIKSENLQSIWKDTVLVCKDVDLIPPNNTTQSLPLARYRRYHQYGYFSIINYSDLNRSFIQLTNDRGILLDKIIIPKESKLSFLNTLKELLPINFYGLDEDTLLCDSDIKLKQIIEEFKKELKKSKPI